MPKWLTRNRAIQASQRAPLRAAISQGDRRALQRRGHAPLFWQDEIDIYDDNGPGIVGNYLDLIEDRVRDAGIQVEFLDAGGDWQPLTDSQMLNVCLGTLSTYSNEAQTPGELIAAHARLSASMGEAYGLAIPSPNARMAHYVAHVREMQDWQPRTGEAAGSVVWENPSTGVKRRIWFPSSELWRSWVPRKSDPQFPTSELKRAIPHIREYIDLLVRSSSDSRSRIMMNDLLVFGPDSDAIDDDEDPLDGMPMVITDWIEQAQQENNTPYHQRRPIAEQVPFPMVGDKPEKVEIGRPLDPSLQEHESVIVARIASSLRCPKKYLLEGPGDSKYDNEAYLTNALLDDCIDPIGSRVCSDVTRLFFRPALQRTLELLGRNPDGYVPVWRLRLAINIDKIRPKPDKTADVISGWKLGLVSPDAVTDVLDVAPMKRPPDMDDWEYWQATTKLAGGKGDPAAGKPAVGTTAEANPAGTTAASLTPVAPELILATLTPPEPVRPTETQGDGKDATLAATLAGLVVLDQRLFASLEGASRAELRRAYAELGRAVSRALPARSAIRQKIRDVPDSGKWAALDDNDRAMANLDLAALTAGMFDELGAQAQSEMRGQLAAADRQLAGQEIQPNRDPMHVNLAGKLLIAGLTRLLISRAQIGSDSDSVPDRLVIDAMLAAGGAKAEATGVAFDHSGVPLSFDGTADAPGTGAAVGPATVRAIRASGHSIQWRWAHALYRIPETPYEPHAALDNVISASPGVLEGQYPGDHPWCSCGYIPVVGE